MLRWLCVLLLPLALYLSSSFAANTHGTPSTQQELQAWFGDTLEPFHVSACLPTTSGTTTVPAFTCKGYVLGPAGDLVYVDQPSSAVGPLNGGDGLYWLAIHKDLSTAVSGWTRQTGTHYLWRLSATEPAAPTHGSLIARATVATSAVTLIADYRVPLSYAQFRHYDLTDTLYGGAGDALVGGGGTDNTPAFNKAVRAAGRRGGVLHIPVGRYNFTTKPTALFNGITIRCADQRNTVLVRKYSEATAGAGFIDMNVANSDDPTVSNSGGGIDNCTLYAETGTTGGSGVNIQSSATTGQGFVRVDRLYITGAGVWDYGVRMDGSLKTSAPEGVRVVWVNDTLIFQADKVSLLALGFNHIFISNTSGFGTTSAGANECLVADAGTGATINSEDLTVQLGFCSAGVRIGSGGAAQISNINLNIPHTTLLTLNANVNNLTYLGDASNTSGVVSVGSSARVSQWVPGRILAGVNSPTASGGLIETGNGITFPAAQVPQNQRNTMDDYEKDVYTPTVYASTTAGTTTYDAQKGYYTKMGNVVCVSAIVAWSNQTGTGNLRMSLPFTPLNDGGNYTIPLNVIAHNLAVGAGKQLAAGVATGGALEAIFYAIDVDAGGALAQVAIDTAATVYLGGCYHAAN